MENLSGFGLRRVGVLSALIALTASLLVVPAQVAYGSGLNDAELFIRDASATTNLIVLGEMERDSSGNVYVAGRIHGRLTLPGGGTVQPVQWDRFTPTSQAVLMKLNSDGELLWSRTFGSTNSFFHGLSANADRTQFAVAGTLRRDSNYPAEVNMNPAGTTFNVAVPGDPHAIFAVYDTDGKLVGDNSDSAWALPASTEAHGVHWDGDMLYVGGKFSYSNSGGTCSDGKNFHLSGDSGTSFSNFCGPAQEAEADAFVAKYNLATSAELQWVRAISNSVDGFEVARYMDTDVLGNLYIGVSVRPASTGATTYSVGPKTSDNSAFLDVSISGREAMLLKIDSTGEPQWGFGVMGRGNTRDLEGIHVEGDKVYIIGMLASGTWNHKGTGSSDVNLSGPASGYSGLLVQYNTEGQHQWNVITRWVSNPSSVQRLDRFSSIDTDASGNVYVAGSYRGNVDFDPSANDAILPMSDGCGLHQDRVVASYSSTGSFRWAKNPGNECAANTTPMRTALHFDRTSGSEKVLAIFRPFASNQPFFVGYGADTIAPTVASVSSGSPNGSYREGATLTLRVNFSEPVVVTGTPQLTLETGATDGVANYVSGSGTSTLTFGYTVAASDASSDLDYVATNSLELNGGTIEDLAGNTAVLTLPTPGASGSLASSAAIILDNVAPTLVSSNPAASSTGVAVASSLSFTFSETVHKGTGSFKVYSGSMCGTLDQTILVSSGRVTMSGSTATVSFAAPNQLSYASQTCVEIESGAIIDAAGNAFLGLSNPDGLNFATEPEPTTAPNAPTINTITPGDGQLTVAFTQGSDGGAAISNYEVSLNGGSFEAFDPEVLTSPAVITGLTNGTAYTVRLKAVNSKGASAPSGEMSGIPVAPAPAPSPSPSPAPAPTPGPTPAPTPAATPTPTPPVTTPPVTTPPAANPPATPRTPAAPTPPPVANPAPAADPAPAAETPAGPGALVLRAEEVFEGTIFMGTDTEELIMPAFVLQDIATRLAPDGAPLDEGALVIESGRAMIPVLLIQLGDVRLAAADMGDTIQFTLNIPGFESSSMSVAVQKQALVWAFWAQLALVSIAAVVAMIFAWWFFMVMGRRKNRVRAGVNGLG